MGSEAIDRIKPLLGSSTTTDSPPPSLLRRPVTADRSTLICQAWSPEQIRARLQHEQDGTIGHEWIYQYISEDTRAGGELYRVLRCQRKWRKGYKAFRRRGWITNPDSIDERPGGVNAHERIRAWEGDTVIGKGHRGVFVTVGERTSKYTVLQGVRYKTAVVVQQALVHGLQRYKARVHTSTYYNDGLEFSEQVGIAQDLEA